MRICIHACISTCFTFLGKRVSQARKRWQASRHVNGTVILYCQTITGSMQVLMLGPHMWSDICLSCNGPPRMPVWRDVTCGLCSMREVPRVSKNAIQSVQSFNCIFFTALKRVDGPSKMRYAYSVQLPRRGGGGHCRRLSTSSTTSLPGP